MILERVYSLLVFHAVGKLHSVITRTVKKFFLASNLTHSLNSSLRSDPSSDTETVDRVALDASGSRKLNHSFLSTSLKPLIVLNTSIMSPRARRSVSVVSPTFSSLSSYVFPLLFEIIHTILRCTFSRTSLSPAAHGDQSATACSSLGLINVL